MSLEVAVVLLLRSISRLRSVLLRVRVALQPRRRARGTAGRGKAAVPAAAAGAAVGTRKGTVPGNRVRALVQVPRPGTLPGDQLAQLPPHPIPTKLEVESNY